MHRFARPTMILASILISGFGPRPCLAQPPTSPRSTAAPAQATLLPSPSPPGQPQPRPAARVATSLPAPRPWQTAPASPVADPAARQGGQAMPQPLPSTAPAAPLPASADQLIVNLKVRAARADRPSLSDQPRHGACGSPTRGR